MIGLASAIAAVGCGLLAMSIILWALAVSVEEEEQSERKRRKIKRVAHHTNGWRDAR